MSENRSTAPQHFWTSRSGVALLMVLVILAVYVIIEHMAPLFGALPFSCCWPVSLMHLFMHGGHGHGDKHHR